MIQNSNSLPAVKASLCQACRGDASKRVASTLGVLALKRPIVDDVFGVMLCRLQRCRVVS